MTNDLLLRLGDQLFEALPDGLPGDASILMSEDWGLATRVRHHQQKLVLFFSAMRHDAERLRGLGREVIYSPLATPDSPGILAQCLEIATARGIERIHVYEVSDRAFRFQIRTSVEGAGLKLVVHPNPMFLTTAEDWSIYRSAYKRLLMGDFYIYVRKKLNILVDRDGRPKGGQWSFDSENRKPFRAKMEVPPIWLAACDEITREVMRAVEGQFNGHAGAAQDFGYPVTHAGARAWLDEFLEMRLDDFGDYEDALSETHRVGFHSLLSPLLNTGLLTPREVIEHTLARHDRRPVPLNSLEGFLRQVIGWREFIRRVYDEYPEERPNVLGHSRTLKPFWWNGTTGLLPLDTVIKRAQDHGYAHHIERLMVAGAVMLMCEVDPNEAYGWFMEMFIDSADWVMLPNVIGMSQFADGGLFATKPYISGSAYLRKMSDFSPGPWCEVWDGLYWRFIHRHRELLAKNPRMSLVVKSLDKLEPVRRDRIFSAAEAFVDRVTEGQSAH